MNSSIHRPIHPSIDLFIHTPLACRNAWSLCVFRMTNSYVCHGSVICVRRNSFVCDLFHFIKSALHSVLHNVCVSSLQCVAVCCSVLQNACASFLILKQLDFCNVNGCVAVCCSVLQCIAMCCSMLQRRWVFQCQWLCCSVLQRVAVSGSVLQWQCFLWCHWELTSCCRKNPTMKSKTQTNKNKFTRQYLWRYSRCVAVCCSVWLCVVVRCSALQCSIASIFTRQYLVRYLQRVAACCSVLQRVAACCSELQWVVACCSELQCFILNIFTRQYLVRDLRCVAACCSVLQCVVMCCSVLQ